MKENNTNKMIDDFISYYHRFWGEMRSLDRDFKAGFPFELKGLIDIGYYENQPMYVIAEQMKLSRSQITSIIEVLVKKGMVIRVTDEKDRRINRVVLTAEGRKMREKYLEVFKKHWNQKLSSLTTEEFEELYKSIETIKKVTIKIMGSKDE